MDIVPLDPCNVKALVGAAIMNTVIVTCGGFVEEINILWSVCIKLNF